MNRGLVRIAITDHIQLARIDLVRRRLGDKTAAKTAGRLLDAQLDAMGIDKLPTATSAVATPTKPRRGKPR